MNTTYRTADILGNLILLIILLAVILCLAACGAPKAFPVGSPDPLDTPGGPDTTLPTIRQQHMRAITGNPGYR